jgi:hypothetical protein
MTGGANTKRISVWVRVRPMTDNELCAPPNKFVGVPLRSAEVCPSCDAVCGADVRLDGDDMRVETWPAVSTRTSSRDPPPEPPQVTIRCAGWWRKARRGGGWGRSRGTRAPRARTRCCACTWCCGRHATRGARRRSWWTWPARRSSQQQAPPGAATRKWRPRPSTRRCFTYAA